MVIFYYFFLDEFRHETDRDVDMKMKHGDFQDHSLENITSMDISGKNNISEQVASFSENTIERIYIKNEHFSDEDNQENTLDLNDDALGKYTIVSIVLLL